MGARQGPRSRSGRTALLAALMAVGATACRGDTTDSAEPSTGVKTVDGCPLAPGAECAGNDLGGANLVGANLVGANLVGANLNNANLSNADLSGANLTGANLSSATLVKTDLTGANLAKADFTAANLRDVELDNTTRCGTIRVDGGVDNTSCPERSRDATGPGGNQRARNAGGPVVTIPCSQADLLQLFKIQAPQFGVPPPAAQAATATANPACAHTFATMAVGLPPDAGGQIVALYAAMADRPAWQLVGLNGCRSSSVSIPADQAGIC